MTYPPEIDTSQEVLSYLGIEMISSGNENVGRMQHAIFGLESTMTRHRNSRREK